MFDKTTYRLLKKLYSCEKLPQSDVDDFTNSKGQKGYSRHISFLLEDHLIDESCEGEEMDENGRLKKRGITYYRINLRGRAYVEQKRRDFRNFWVPYIITTIVAVASLLVAIAGFLRNA